MYKKNQTKQTKNEKPLKTKAVFLSYGSLILGILSLSFSPLFTHWADAPGIVTSFFRMLIATVVLAPFFIINIKKNLKTIKKIPFRLFILPILAGIFSAFDHAFWGTAIKHTNVANATILNYIAPLWVSLIAIFVFNERHKKVYWFGLIMIFIGAMIVMNLLQEDSTHFSFKGEGFAIISSIFYAFYFLLTQKGRVYYLAIQQLWISLFTCCIILTVLVIILKLPILGYPNFTYINIILAAIISQICGYFCLTYALGKIPASVVSPSLILQPVITSILAIPLANQLLTKNQIFGGVLVIVGVFLVNRSQNDNVNSEQ